MRMMIGYVLTDENCDPGSDKKKVRHTIAYLSFIKIECLKLTPAVTAGVIVGFLLVFLVVLVLALITLNRSGILVL